MLSLTSHLLHPMAQPRTRRARGFTLIELLVVIAIIGILAALLFPSVRSARITANRAKTRVQFNQWAAAMEQFKQEYGYYPQIDSGGSANKVNPVAFAVALTGRNLDGTTVAPAGNHFGNTKLISFYSIAENELSADRTALVDAFANTDFAVYYDKDGDGRIASPTDGARVAVVSSGGNTFTPDDNEMDLTKGVRAGVIFYSAGNGLIQSDLVFSWK